MIVIRLDPRKLANPDLDLRYVLPERLTERSGGALRAAGYDYAGAPPFLLIFMAADRPEDALGAALDLVRTEEILGNRLSAAAVVAVADPDGVHVAPEVGAVRVAYPPGFSGAFTPDDDADDGL